MNFIFTLPRTIIFGQGSIERLSSEAGNFGIGTVLLVTSRGMTQRGTAQRITDLLAARVKIYDRVDPEPSIEHVEEWTPCVCLRRSFYRACTCVGRIRRR